MRISYIIMRFWNLPQFGKTNDQFAEQNSTLVSPRKVRNMGKNVDFCIQAWREAVAAPTPVPGECAQKQT